MVIFTVCRRLDVSSGWLGRVLADLIRLWTASSRAADPDTLRAAYDACLGFIKIPYLFLDDQSDRGEYRSMALRQLEHDHERLPPDWTQQALRTEPGPPSPDWKSFS
ncbi:hypothetical protein GCM10023334_107020 [Nonomuraea thailandensis]